MIDWVSIVRHSHRRFSNYMYGVPSKVRRRRKRPMLMFSSLQSKSNQVKQQHQQEDEDDGTDTGEESEDEPPDGLGAPHPSTATTTPRRVFMACNLCGCLPKRNALYEDGSNVPAVSAAQMRDMTALDGVPRTHHNHVPETTK
ncbi:unnamed protein product, partial [Meganyctiphanes norvegica]